MRASIVHVLVALLIAVFAIGAPLSARADCATCEDCTIVAPSKNNTPCSQKGVACQMAQNCANQTQKMPVQMTLRAAREATAVAFGQASTVAIKLAKITPETTPPRL